MRDFQRFTSSHVRTRDPAYARFASFGGFESAEARSAKVDSGDPWPHDVTHPRLWIPDSAEKNGVWLP
jgi:hypothetical protein